MTEQYGPQVEVCYQLHADKYRGPNESFEGAMYRISAALADDDEHRTELKDILLHQRFMPAGRIQAAVGSPKDVTAFNCFVSGLVEDSMESLYKRTAEAAETMRRGGGIGYDFSRLRPRGDRIASLGSTASGPVSFMAVFDAWCATILSAGHRRGAMMGVLRVDHPDIQEFIRAKQNKDKLLNFNISVGVTDEFMKCVETGEPFDLVFEDHIYDSINASALWDEIMRANWDWAEPGVLFIDKINEDNNLHYCETIEATNPCGEQPLPPYGACLLGSFNLVKYVSGGKFDYKSFTLDIDPVVRAMDNVVDRTVYPLPDQEVEAKQKRRMGLGITGLANTLSMMGVRYGSPEAVRVTRRIMRTLTNTCYEASVVLAREKGSFPACSVGGLLMSGFIKRLPDHIKKGIEKYGLRNSHLISIAPTGTISFTADNVSSGIEPVFALEVNRTYLTEEGPKVVDLKDYAWANYGVKGEVTEDLTTDQHINMVLACAPYVDSSISKTINVGNDVTFDEFKDIYVKCWRGGAKGCTTFRPAGKRYGILISKDTVEPAEGAACFIDPETGQKECG
jgi:ribonucleoside-diphosphate reductase alpha chain